MPREPRRTVGGGAPGRIGRALPRSSSESRSHASFSAPSGSSRTRHTCTALAASGGGSRGTARRQCWLGSAVTLTRATGRSGGMRRMAPNVHWAPWRASLSSAGAASATTSTTRRPGASSPAGGAATASRSIRPPGRRHRRSKSAEKGTNTTSRSRRPIRTPTQTAIGTSDCNSTDRSLEARRRSWPGGISAAALVVAALLWGLGDATTIGTVLLFMGRWVFLLPLLVLVPLVAWLRARLLLPLAVGRDDRHRSGDGVPQRAGGGCSRSRRPPGSRRVLQRRRRAPCSPRSCRPSSTRWQAQIVAFQECGEHSSPRPQRTAGLAPAREQGPVPPQPLPDPEPPP